MVIDELIAKLGFKVDGLDALKRAVEAMKAFVRNVLNAVNPLKKAGAAANPLKAAMQKTAAAAAPATAAMGRMASVARVVALGLAGVVTAAVAAGGAVVTLAMAFSKAARARREFQIEAAGKGTTAKRFDLLRNTLAASAGVGEKKAETLTDALLGGVNEKLKEALAGDADAKASLKKFGMAARDKAGKPVDASALALQVATRFIAEAAKAEELRKNGKIKQATATAEKNDAFAKDFGIADDLKAALNEFPTVKAFNDAISAAGRRDAGATTEQEERSRRVSVAFAELEQKVAALGSAFDQLNTIIADNLLGPANYLVDKVVSLAKRLGLVNKTRAEADADSLAENERLWSDKRERGRFNPPETAGDVRRRAAAESAEKLDALRQGRNAPPESSKPDRPSWLDGFLRGLRDEFYAVKTTLGEGARRSVQKDADRKVEENDNRTYTDIGNDKRTISNSVTVNATGLEAVAAAVGRSIAASINKSANTSTGVVTAP